ncbi:MAG TPA: hypothetical protein VFX50_05435, partial [Gemmatimonadales bacterium]|nr:hypothetical protein [Gemmatimonadales bacterium]
MTPPHHRRPGAARRHPQSGVTYLVLLLAVAITSAVTAATATAWSHMQRREREAQLLWAGDQIRLAIAAYSSVGGDGDRYPRTLEDLVLDPRSLAPRRHLRRVFHDPMTNSSDWDLLRDPAGRIVGVRSRSDAVPIKRGNFPEPYARFAKAKTYADWRFTVLLEPGVDEIGRVPGVPAAAASAGRAASPGDAASTADRTEPAGAAAAAPSASRAPAPTARTADTPAPPPGPHAPSDGTSGAPSDATPRAPSDSTSDDTPHAPSDPTSDAAADAPD